MALIAMNIFFPYKLGFLFLFFFNEPNSFHDKFLWIKKKDLPRYLLYRLYLLELIRTWEGIFNVPIYM